MSLIFEGLERSNYREKRSVRIDLKPNGEASDAQAVKLSLLPKTYSKTLTEPDPSCITINYPAPRKGNISRGNDCERKFYAPQPSFGNSDRCSSSQMLQQKGENIAQQKSSPKFYAPQPSFGNSDRCSSAQALQQKGENTAQQKSSPEKLGRPLLIFERHPSANIEILSFIKRAFSSSLIALESIFVAPFKLLKFLCGTPLRSINFCSDLTVSLGIKLWKSLSSLGHIFYEFIKGIGLFIGQKIIFCYDCIVLGIGKIALWIRQGFYSVGNLFAALFECYRSAFNKIFSIYLPNNWIQGVTSFMLKSCAIAASCCFVIMLMKNFFFTDPQENISKATEGTIALAEDNTPKRKFKHFFRDPLVLKQEKVKNTLLSMHVDTLQRNENQGNITIDNKTYNLGSLMSEHPRIWLDKIGKNSLYFSDKYGQQYKRALADMLE